MVAASLLMVLQVAKIAVGAVYVMIVKLLSVVPSLLRLTYRVRMVRFGRSSYIISRNSVGKSRNPRGRDCAFVMLDRGASKSWISFEVL